MSKREPTKAQIKIHKLICDYVTLKGAGCQRSGVYKININASEYAIACELHCNILQQQAVDSVS